MAESPRDRTTLCAEVPCSPDDDWWNLSPDEAAERIAGELESVGLDVPRPLLGAEVQRLRFAYPIYLTGYEKAFERLDEWASSLPRFLTFGRQGLFAHDNTHHALAMAYAASECMGPEGFDEREWGRYRRAFEKHVVED